MCADDVGQGKDESPAELRLLGQQVAAATYLSLISLICACFLGGLIAVDAMLGGIGPETATAAVSPQPPSIAELAAELDEIAEKTEKMDQQVAEIERKLLILIRQRDQPSPPIRQLTDPPLAP